MESEVSNIYAWYKLVASGFAGEELEEDKRAYQRALDRGIRAHQRKVYTPYNIAMDLIEEQLRNEEREELHNLRISLGYYD